MQVQFFFAPFRRISFPELSHVPRRRTAVLYGSARFSSPSAVSNTSAFDAAYGAAYDEAFAVHQDHDLSLAWARAECSKARVHSTTCITQQHGQIASDTGGAAAADIDDGSQSAHKRLLAIDQNHKDDRQARMPDQRTETQQIDASSREPVQVTTGRLCAQEKTLPQLKVDLENQKTCLALLDQQTSDIIALCEFFPVWDGLAEALQKQHQKIFSKRMKIIEKTWALREQIATREITIKQIAQASRRSLKSAEGSRCFIRSTKGKEHAKGSGQKLAGDGVVFEDILIFGSVFVV